MRSRELPAALDLARRLPDVRFVIDHLAKPPIASGALEPWASLIAPFRDLDHVACKLSGMVTEADWASWTSADLRPYVDHVLEAFGPDRLLFGSDWPVCLLAASYGKVVDTTRTSLSDLDRDELAAVVRRDGGPRLPALSAGRLGRLDVERVRHPAREQPQVVDERRDPLGRRPRLEQRDARGVRALAGTPARDRDPEADDTLDGLLVVHRVAPVADDREVGDERVDGRQGASREDRQLGALVAPPNVGLAR